MLNVPKLTRNKWDNGLHGRQPQVLWIQLAEQWLSCRRSQRNAKRPGIRSCALSTLVEAGFLASMQVNTKTKCSPKVLRKAFLKVYSIKLRCLNHVPYNIVPFGFSVLTSSKISSELLLLVIHVVVIFSYLQDDEIWWLCFQFKRLVVNRWDRYIYGDHVIDPDHFISCRL